MNDPTAALVDLINREVSLDPHQQVDADTDLLLTGLVDSLGVLQIVGWIEDTYGLSVDPSDVVIENFQTVELMSSYLRSRVELGSKS